MEPSSLSIGSVAWMQAIVAVPTAVNSDRLDEEWVERLNYKYTGLQLFIWAIFVGIEQYFGMPISCWVPAHFSGAWEDYTNSYCWVHNTYYLPWVHEIPKHYFERDSRQIVYYQWVPHILLLEAAMFFVPIFLWRGTNSKTGIDINQIVEVADHADLVGDDDEEENMKLSDSAGENIKLSDSAGENMNLSDSVGENMHLSDGVVEKMKLSDSVRERTKWMDFNVRQMHRFLGYKKNKMILRKTYRECTFGVKSILSRLCCCCCGKRFGNYITLMYLGTKMLFLVVVIFQFFLLNWFLGQNYTMYGIDVIRDSIAGIEWADTRRFPKVTLCDVIIRRPGNLHTYTVQCALKGNLFYERIFLWLWFWFLVVSVVTFMNLVTWSLRMLVPSQRKDYVLNMLRYGQRMNATQGQVDEYGSWSSEFVHEYLMADGVLVLRLLDVNSNKSMMAKLTAALWENYVKLRQKQDDMKCDETMVPINSESV